MCEKFAHTRFEPSGWSHNQDIGYAKSIMDYIFRWLQLRFLTGQQQALFDGLRPKYINAPPPGTPDENGYGQKSFGDFTENDGMLTNNGCHPERRARPHRRRSRGTPIWGQEHGAPPRLRRPERPDRPGRRPQLPRLRGHHDAERKLLPLHELRQHQRVLVVDWVVRRFSAA